MHNVYFFSSDDEYQTIARLISSSETLRSELSELIYLNGLHDQYIRYSIRSDFPASLAELYDAYPPCTFSEISDYLICLKEDNQLISNELRFCCYATLGSLEDEELSPFVSRLIKKVKPDSLLILTTDVTQDDVETYFSRKKTKLNVQLPRVSMRACRLNISLLNQQPTLNLNELEDQIRQPQVLFSPFIQPNKTLTLYIFDEQSYQSENIAELDSDDGPYLLVYYDEEEDGYRIMHFNLDGYQYVTENLLDLSMLASSIKDIQLECNLSSRKLNLCCPVHLGRQLGSLEQMIFCMTEVLDALIKKILPTLLILSVRNVTEEEDARQYLSRRPTQLGYQLPNIPMKGAWIHFSDLSNERLLDCIANAEELPVTPISPLKTFTSFTLYITHYSPFEFPMKTIAEIYNKLQHKPHMIVYYSMGDDRYTIKEKSIFSQHQFSFSHRPVKRVHLFDAICVILAKLAIKKLELYTHANLGDPKGSAVTTELDYWVSYLKPDVLNLFSPWQSHQDAWLYSKRGITKQNMKLPPRNMKGYFIDEGLIKEALASFTQGDIDEKTLVKIIKSSPKLSNFFKQKKGLTVYLWPDEISQFVSIEPLVSCCENRFNLSRIVIYYSLNTRSFVVKSTHATLQPLIPPNNHQMSLDRLIQFINIIKQYSGGLARLYCHANLGEGLNTVTPLVDTIVHAVTPLSLYLFCSNEGRVDAESYLNRELTSNRLRIPPIDMRGTCLSEELTQQLLSVNSSKLNMAFHSSIFINEAPILKKPTRDLIPSSELSSRCMPFSNCFFGRTASIFGASIHSMQRSNRVASKKTFSGFDNKVNMFKYSNKMPTNDGCGLMKILTLLDPPYTVKDIVNLFNYRPGILLSQDQLIYINLDFLLECNQEILFNDLLSEDRANILLITETEKNKLSILLLMKMFSSMTDCEYRTFKNEAQRLLFQKITGYNIDKTHEDNSTSLVKYRAFSGV